tara:strand:- start:422 stop:571 length:150 start_codon:yes stop_codon:yes gene_type:complete
MTKLNEVKPIAISSQKDDDNYNLKAKAKKVKEMGASRLIMRMYGEQVDE